MLSGYWNGGAGCSIETLAELMGDTPKVAFDHYGREWGQHYQEPLWAAIGVGESRLVARVAQFDGDAGVVMSLRRRPALPERAWPDPHQFLEPLDLLGLDPDAALPLAPPGGSRS